MKKVIVTTTITRYSPICRAMSVRSQPKVHHLLREKWSASAGEYASRKAACFPIQWPNSQFRKAKDTITMLPTTQNRTTRRNKS